MASFYNNTQILEGESGKRYYACTIYPEIPITDQDSYIITSAGDRLDLIAYDFYKDVSSWRIIASANNLDGSSLYPPVGMQLRIPGNYEKVLSSLENFNKIR